MSQLIAEYKVNDLQSTKNIGQEFYAQLRWPVCIYLQGDLGAGKTTFCQAVIAAAGYSGAVTSPTYNLIQEYPVLVPDDQGSATEELSLSMSVMENDTERAPHAKTPGTIFHMDLYRLQDPEELYFMGVKELWQPNSLFLIEWPEKGKGILQHPDYIVEISKNGAKTEGMRNIHIYQTF